MDDADDVGPDPDSGKAPVPEGMLRFALLVVGGLVLILVVLAVWSAFS